MRKLSEEYRTLALRTGRYPKIKMELYAGTRDDWTDTVEAIYGGENKIISAAYNNGTTTQPDTFEIGNAYIGFLELELSGEAYPELESGKRFKLFTGFYDTENYKTVWAGIGEFFVESVSIENGVTRVQARDKLMYTERRFDPSKLSYPCSLLDLLREVVRQAGFTLPEGYELPVNPTVTAAPLQKLPQGITYRMSDGTVLDGRPYPCRQILGEIAKMQLGNCFTDGDGNIRFSSYAEDITVGDRQIVNLTIDSESYRTNVLMYQEDTGTGEAQELEENVYGTIYYTTFVPSEIPDFDDRFSKIYNKRFYGGTVSQKGIGLAEIGDFIDYAGKLGERRFFVFGVQYEWSGASFDETLYSFAPTYEQDSLSSDNVKTPISQIESSAAAGGSGGGTVYSPGAGIGISGSVISTRIGEGLEYDESGRIRSVPNIQNAVMITEKDAKYLLHNFTQIEYNRGVQIGYAGPGNQIVVQGYLAYTADRLNQGANYISGTQILYPADWTTDLSRYTEISSDFYYGSIHYKRAYSVQTVSTAASATYAFYAEQEDGTVQPMINQIVNQDHWSGFGLALEWMDLYPPGSVQNGITFENGYARARFHYFWKSNFNPDRDFVYDRWYVNTWYVFPFASLAEYQAAVGLTYEPLTLTRVEDNPTVASGSEIGKEATEWTQA